MENFFDTLTVYLEAKAFFEKFVEDNTTIAALKKTKKELLHCYHNEQDMIIFCIMSVYWLYLQNGLQSIDIREELASISQDEIKKCFGKDAETVYSTLKELLNKAPVPVVRKKAAKYAVTATWKPGDIYAYRLHSGKAQQAGLAEQYVLLYVFGNQKTKTLTAQFFCLFCRADEIDQNAEKTLQEATFFPHCVNQNYRYVLLDDNDNFPTENIRYIGNVLPLRTPENEIIPLSGLYYRYMKWEDFEESVIRFIKKFLTK